MKKILFTGGSGLLGSEMKKLFPDDLFPERKVFDVTDESSMRLYLKKNPGVRTIVHMAALTSPPIVEKDPIKAIDANIIGTSNVVKICTRNRFRLVYISTDYVFRGDKGNYSEDSPMYPVNKYAWSKLGGECAVKLYDDHAIIRLSFGPNEFPFDGAFIDQWTSREKVSDIAKKIETVIVHSFYGTIHIGSRKRTVYEYAKSVSPEKNINKISIRDIKTRLPADTSLDISLYESIFK